MKDKMKQLADSIKKYCKADDYAFHIVESQDLHTRFAQNGITQHINGTNLQISLEVSFDNKTGAAEVNQTDEDSLKNLVKTAENLAKLNKPDPEFVSSETAHDLRNFEKPAERTLKLSTKEVVDGIEKCIANAKKKNAKISGISQKNITSHYMETKNGFNGYDKTAHFSHSMTMKKGGIETKVERSCRDYSDFSMQNNIEQLNSQFDSLQEPQKMDYGRLPVIIRPQAFLTWIYYLSWTFQRREADEGMNPYTNKIGKRFFGENFTMRSIVDDPKIQAPRFNFNGIPTKNIDWILNGVIKNMQTGRYYAKKKKIAPASIFNVVIDGGNSSEEEMLKMVDRGIILNSFWYIRPVDMKSGEWTGLTRDGVLYFEDGKIKNAVTNFRWNEILHNATKKIIALGPSQQIQYNAKVPTVLINDFNFVDVTTF